MKTQKELSKYIYKKLYIYLASFDRLPDSIIISQEDYNTIKDNNLIKQLDVKINYVPYPILFHK